MNKDFAVFEREFLESKARISLAKKINPGSRIHLIGVCGTGMTQVAVLLKDLGFYVTGSDKAFYPPMGDIARATVDKIFEGYNPSNLSERPDLVVVGNAVSKTNPEVQAMLEQQISFVSMPEVFSALLIGDREHCPTSIVVAGTHGKTTTSCAVATLFDVNGYAPGYFVGGAPLNLPSGIRKVDTSIELSKRVVVLEGDEYDSAYFAKWSKFQSYRPDIALITSLEFDHGDIFDSIEEIEREFNYFVSGIPSSGYVLAWDGNARLRNLCNAWKSDRNVSAKVLVYGQDESSDFRLVRRSAGHEGQLLECLLEGTPITLETKLSGIHNALNLLAVAAVGYLQGLSIQEIQRGVSSFSGVKRRQQLICEAGGITVFEDFAHHPTAVDVTLQGIKERFASRRLVAVFEPRSTTSRRDYFQQEYTKCWRSADVVAVQEVQDTHGYIRPGEDVKALDVKAIVQELTDQGQEAYSFPDSNSLKEFLFSAIRPSDVVVIMSNGDFGGIMRDLKTELTKRYANS